MQKNKVLVIQLLGLLFSLIAVGFPLFSIQITYSLKDPSSNTSTKIGESIVKFGLFFYSYSMDFNETYEDIQYQLPAVFKDVIMFETIFIIFFSGIPYGIGIFLPLKMSLIPIKQKNQCPAIFLKVLQHIFFLFCSFLYL